MKGRGVSPNGFKKFTVSFLRALGPLGALYTNYLFIESFNLSSFYESKILFNLKLVLESLVYSGLLPFFGKTGTETSPSKLKTQTELVRG